MVKTSGKNPSTSNGFKTNKYGTLYKSEKASFTPNTNIITRKTGPFRSMKQAGILKAGKKINYDEVMKQDGYVWLGYEIKRTVNTYQLELGIEILTLWDQFGEN